MPDPLERGPLESMVAGALKECIAAHGPITKESLSSAAKRVVGGLLGRLKAVAKEELAASAATLVLRQNDDEYKRLRAKNKSLRKQRYHLLQMCRGAGLLPPDDKKDDRD